MFQLLLALALAVPAAQTKDPVEAGPERIEKALKSLEQAFAKGKADERVEAIVAHQEVVDPAVLRWMAKGLKDGDAKVRDAAAEALRFARHADALDALQDALKRERKSGKDVEWLVKLTKCVGQHQSESSIELLAENALQPPDPRLIEARVLGLANIRSNKAAEELIGLMRAAGRDKVQPYMGTFRLALVALTGVDKGLSQDEWMAWWNDNKSKLEVKSELPPLPKDLYQRWAYYWGLERIVGRDKKRGERGDDPERRE